MVVVSAFVIPSMLELMTVSVVITMVVAWTIVIMIVVVIMVFVVIIAWMTWRTGKSHSSDNQSNQAAQNILHHCFLLDYELSSIFRTHKQRKLALSSK